MSMSAAFLQNFRKALGLLLPDYAGTVGATTVTATGTVQGADLVATDDLTVGDDVLISGSLTVTELATTRVPYMSTAGLMKSEAALTYIEGTDTLNAVNFAGTTATLTGALQALGITATADIAAVGGFRRDIGPFMAPGAAGVTAASQTNLDCRYAHASASVSDFIATRAGSIVGLSGQLDTAATGGTATIGVKVTVDGTELVSGPELSFTTAGAEVTDFAVAAKDAHAFAAGARINISYTSSADLSNTPKLVCSVEIEN